MQLRVTRFCDREWVWLVSKYASRHPNYWYFMLVEGHRFDIFCVCLKSWRSFGGIPERVKDLCELMLLQS